MGLRERKAQRVRDAIHEAMLTLTEERGYDAATVDQVAERAEVGVSTIYRYFENKDAILLAPAADDVAALAEAFTARPADEDVMVSLAHALHEVLDHTSEERAGIKRLRAQLDLAPGPRARLWDIWYQQRLLLEEAISARIGPQADSLWVAAAAHIAMAIVQIAMDHDRDTFDDVNPAEYADRLIGLLHGAGAPLPVQGGQRSTTQSDG
jgi:AcrR family transcriptional regulator